MCTLEKKKQQSIQVPRETTPNAYRNNHKNNTVENKGKKRKANRVLMERMKELHEKTGNVVRRGEKLPESSRAVKGIRQGSTKSRNVYKMYFREGRYI